MRPLGFLTGVVLGSAASIALVLVMVTIVFAFTAHGQAAVGEEYAGLLVRRPFRHSGGQRPRRPS